MVRDEFWQIGLLVSQAYRAQRYKMFTLRRCCNTLILKINRVYYKHRDKDYLSHTAFLRPLRTFKIT